MSRVLLIRPPAVPLDVGFLGKARIGKMTDMCFPKGLPLGILGISSYLRNYTEHEVYVYDSMYDFDYKKFLRRNDLRFDEFVFGASDNKIIGKIKDIKPDYVGISNQFTPLKDQAMKLARLVKSIDSNIILIIGGSHASSFPKDFMEEKSIDIVVGGEGEEIMKYILDDNIKKGVFLDNHVEDLNKLPIPNYKSINIEKLFEFEKVFAVRERPNYDGSERNVSFITSRGCPYNCCFCTIHNIVGRKWRPFSVDYVVNHIKDLKDRYNVKHFHFEDDNITLDLDRFKTILRRIKDFQITWDTPNGLRADRLDEEAIKLCKKSGCYYLIIGIESAKQNIVANIISKDLNLKKVMKTIKLAHKHKLRLKAFFVIGFPGETRKDIDDTLDFAFKLHQEYAVEPDLSILHPYVGSRVYYEAKKKGILVKSINEGHVDMIKTDEFDETYLEGKFVEFYKLIKTKN